MKESSSSEEIKGILREQRVTQIEYYNYINDTKVPKAAESIVNGIYELIRYGGSSLKVALTPDIVLDYTEFKVYYRILPLDAAPLFNYENERSRIFRSEELNSLLDIKRHEIYAEYARKAVCKILAKRIKNLLKEEGFSKVKIKEIREEWSTSKKDIHITFK